MPLSNVVIVLARCRRTGHSFGIRVEEKFPGQWKADWAFPIKENVARKEGYGRSEIRGSFSLDDAYPGCPHCTAKPFARCGCGKVACWDGESQTITCPWCGSRGTISGQIDRLTGGGDP